MRYLRRYSLILSMAVIWSLLISCGSEKPLFEVTGPEYANVSSELKKDANSVLHSSRSVLSLRKDGTATHTIRNKITILNEQGDDEGNVILPYDSFRHPEYAKVQITDKFGLVAGKFTLGDFKDFSASGSSFFSDVRVKVLPVFNAGYPYTIEYEYEYTYDGTLNLPNWLAQSYDQSVEKAVFEFRDYTKGNLRFFERNAGEPQIRETESYMSGTWEISNRPAIENQAFNPALSELVPYVKTAVSDFKMEHSSGNADTWKAFGKWYHSLSEGKQALPEKARKEVDALIAGARDEKEITEILYRYMQDKVQYVSIQLGLGGWEPFPAAYVYNKSYGDCKALVNFMLALLDYAGVESRPALIRRGMYDAGVIESFPSNQFNHVVLRVELENGEIMWLECTSKFYRPGRLGPDNEGKTVLIVSAEGGEISRTPLSDENENLVERSGIISIGEDGSADISYTVNNFGVAEDQLFSRLKPESVKEREEWLRGTIRLTDYSLQSYAFHTLSSEEPAEAPDYSFELSASDYTATTPSRIFVPMNKLGKIYLNIPGNEDRVQPLELPYLLTEKDSVVFRLPQGYEPESVPENISLDSEFGSYTLQRKVSDTEIRFKREVYLSRKHISVDEFEDFHAFITDINRNDNQRFVLKKK